LAPTRGSNHGQGQRRAGWRKQAILVGHQRLNKRLLYEASAKNLGKILLEVGRHSVLLFWGSGECRPQNDSARAIAAIALKMGTKAAIARAPAAPVIAQRLLICRR
jgi:hypothetical protein